MYQPVVQLSMFAVCVNGEIEHERQKMFWTFSPLEMTKQG